MSTEKIETDSLPAILAWSGFEKRNTGSGI